MLAVVDAMPSFKNLEATLASECSTSNHQDFDDKVCWKSPCKCLGGDNRL